MSAETSSITSIQPEEPTQDEQNTDQTHKMTKKEVTAATERETLKKRALQKLEEIEKDYNKRKRKDGEYKDDVRDNLTPITSKAISIPRDEARAESIKRKVRVEVNGINEKLETISPSEDPDTTDSDKVTTRDIKRNIGKAVSLAEENPDEARRILRDARNKVRKLIEQKKEERSLKQQLRNKIKNRAWSINKIFTEIRPRHDTASYNLMSKIEILRDYLGNKNQNLSEAENKFIERLDNKGEELDNIIEDLIGTL